MAPTRGTITRIALGALGAAGAVLAMPAAASAAVTCTLASATLDVSLSAGTTQVTIQRGGGADPDQIRVLDGFFGTEQACTGGPATVNNTDTVQVVDGVATQNTFVNVGLANGPLGPGATTELTGTSEIEVSFNAGDGTDTQRVFAGGSPDVYLFGSTGASSVGGNLNSDDDVNDVTINEGERLALDGGAGNDDLSVNGGSGFIGAVPYSSGGSAVLQLNGGPDNDHLTAGPGGWTMDPSNSAGDDVITGGGGTDEAHLEVGNDTADGGGGSSDFLSYQFAPAGVHVDLGVTAQQDTVVAGLDTATNFENIVGSQAVGPGDVLIGDQQANTINANTGDDLLIGKGGDDRLNAGAGSDTASYAVGSTGPVTVNLGTTAAQPTGGAGTDTLPDGGDMGTESDVENLTGSPFGGDVLTGNNLANFFDVRDGFADTVTCLDPPPPPPADSVRADSPGVDAINADCEEVDFAAAPPPPSSPQDALAPDTSVSGKRKIRTRKSRARVTFALASTEPGSSFECSIDSRPFVPCVSPFSTKLRIGRHLLAVRSRDAAGNVDGLPATLPVRVRRLLPAP
jgi:hypothetical protein